MEAVDCILQDGLDSTRIFGSIVVQFGREFRRIHPVVERAVEKGIIDSTWPVTVPLTITHSCIF